MRRERKRYTAEFKARVALEATKEQKTLNELGAQFGVHPTQIMKWKKQLVAHLPDVFARGCTRGGAHADALENDLYQEIGRLQMELAWLKKKVGMEGR